ncbi:MAG TPA: hypothetical protein VNT60_09140 [Deinococcales bacterium]|nr:hypothetical protein [Deinococcales bacterium]
MLKALVAAVTALVLAALPVLAQSRQGIARFQYGTDGSITINVLDREGREPLAVEWLRLAAIGDQYARGRTVQGSVTRVDDSTYRGTLGLGEGSWNLDIRVSREGQELRGNWLISSDAMSEGDVPLVLPSTDEVSRISRLVGFTFLGVIAVGILVTLWGLLRGRRAVDEEDARAAELPGRRS